MPISSLRSRAYLTFFPGPVPALARLVLGSAVVTLLAASPPASAQAQTGTQAAASDARLLFQRISSAARASNYQGTMVFRAGDLISSSRVGHYVVGEQSYESLEALDGKLQRSFRHNDTVHTLWPQSRVAVIERREPLTARATTPQAVDPLALTQYELRREGLARVAGREAEVLWMEPRDELRYAQRLWTDRATALMLRADVMGPLTGGTRVMLESTAFSSVEIGVKAQPNEVLLPLERLDGYRVLRPQQRRTSLEAEGWTLARPVPGFQLAGALQRGMNSTGSAEPVLQAVFTDGLIHVSLFIEPVRPAQVRSESQSLQGARASLTQRKGEHWLTAVGEVPLATLKLFVAAVDRR